MNTLPITGRFTVEQWAALFDQSADVVRGTLAALNLSTIEVDAAELWEKLKRGAA